MHKNSLGRAQRVTWAIRSSAMLLALLAAPLTAHAQQYPTVIGSLANFDVVNDTEGEKHGFEIQLEDLHSSDITRVFGQAGSQCYIRYCIGSIVEYPPTATAPGGVYVRWTSNYDPINKRFVTNLGAPGGGSAGTPNPDPAHPSLVSGEVCWSLGLGNAYPTSGCEHFGVSTLRNPSKTTYRWLVGDPATGVIAPGFIAPGVPAPPVPIAHPVQQVVLPAVPGGLAEVEAVIKAADPAAGFALAHRFGVAQWVKVYKIEIPRNADLDELVGGHPNNVVPNAQNAVAETEWKLMQFDTLNPDNGASLLRSHGSSNSNSHSVIRRYEFYKYTGRVVAPGGTSGKGGTKLSTDDQEASQCPRNPDTNECTEPGPGELGAYIGAQMAAANLDNGAALLSQNISFDLPAALTFGDAAFALTAIGGGSGNPVTFVSSGACALGPDGLLLSITSAGTCIVTASQAGSDIYAAAPDVTRSTIVAKQNATIAFDAATLSQVYDGTAKTVSTTTTPAGLQTDLSFIGSPVNAGSYLVTATINDPNYAGTAADALVITKAPQFIFLDAIAAHRFGDAPFTISATGGDSGNPVTFTASGACSAVGALVTIGGAGTCNIQASQAGNDNYEAAGEVVQGLDIAKAAQTISFAALASRTFGDAAFAVSATGGASGNAVTFSAAGACTAVGNLVSIAGAGSCTITASQAGDANYDAAEDVAQAFAIARASQAIAFGPIAGRTFGDAAFAAVAVGGASGNAVTFTAAGACSVVGNTVTIGGAGSCTLTASQAGNANYNAAADVAQTFAIAQASQTIGFAALPNRTFGDAPFAVSATGGGSGNAIDFSAIGACSVTGALVTLTAPGDCTITASQAGNANFAAAAPVSRSFTINAAPPVNTNPIVNPGNQTNREGDEVELQIQLLQSNARRGDDKGGDDRRGRFAAANLPDGLQIENSKGVIKGKVKKNAAGSYAVTVMFTADGQTFAQSFNWTILASAKGDNSGKGSSGQDDKSGKNDR